MTPSELHVARLAAAGLSNAAIARARRTSVRTVANQVGKVLRELSVGSRRALAARAELTPELPPAPAIDWAVLPGRERAVAARAASGVAQKVIAIEMGLGQATVSRTLRSARARLGLASVQELVRAASLAASGGARSA